VPGPLNAHRARLAALAISVIAALAVAGCDVSEDADVDRGRELFVAKCGTCHTLAQAGSGANIGPNLDAAFARARADGMDSDTIEGVVQKQIAHPRIPNVPEGTPEYTATYMPPDIVEGQDAEDVATYVGSVAGVPGAKPPPLGDSQNVFTTKCGICHTLKAAGTTATTGPDLDQVLAGKDATYIEKQIVDPNSEIAQGYGPNIMPQDFRTTLPPDVLKALVDYLVQSIGK
jgi:mono/diheme cytochrome c family protein